MWAAVGAPAIALASLHISFDSALGCLLSLHLSTPLNIIFCFFLGESEGQEEKTPFPSL